MFVWGLWHINLGRLFNAKSNFYTNKQFYCKKIQFSISTQFNCQKHFYFANGPGDLGSIPGRIIPKTQKMVLDATLLNTQHCKVKIKGEVE